MPRSKAGAKAKGRTGEREVAAIWRAYGWERACPTPGSGALRPWGAGDVPAWPGDIAFIYPFCCEVKRDERLNAPSRGWTGEAFIRATIRDHSKLVARLNGTVGGKRLHAVVVGRASFSEHRWWIPERAFRTWVGAYHDPLVEYSWVELDTTTFFDYAQAVT